MLPPGVLLVDKCILFFAPAPPKTLGETATPWKPIWGVGGLAAVLILGRLLFSKHCKTDAVRRHTEESGPGDEQILKYMFGG